MKVIILHNILSHYRVPVWNLLAKRCDLTIAYSLGDGTIPDGMHCEFKILHLPYRKFGDRIVIQKDNIRNLVKEFDVVVAIGDIAWLKYSTLPWWNSKIKFVFHTLGVSASYKKGYDQKKGWDRIRTFFYKRASSLVFYTDYPIKKYERLGIPAERMFVAPNTVEVQPKNSFITKDSILMIGTLYREKGVQLLLEAYEKLKNIIALPQLYLVGEGPDYNLIKEWINSHSMSDIIHLEGSVYEISRKAEYFARALACISPKQAGLSVLESMGYGVPFVTSKNAITGGEIFNIHDGIDGVIYKTDADLAEIIRDIAENPNKYLELGKNAKKFYDENRTIHHMVDGLWRAIKYAYSH